MGKMNCRLAIQNAVLWYSFFLLPDVLAQVSTCLKKVTTKANNNFFFSPFLIHLSCRLQLNDLNVYIWKVKTALKRKCAYDETNTTFLTQILELLYSIFHIFVQSVLTPFCLIYEVRKKPWLSVNPWITPTLVSVSRLIVFIHPLLLPKDHSFTQDLYRPNKELCNDKTSRLAVFLFTWSSGKKKTTLICIESC